MESTALRQIGYWRSRSKAEPTLPDPRDFLDPTWDEEERRIVAAYLRDGRRTGYSMGFSPCRLCGCRNGDATLADEVYEWPQGLAHYVEEHSVRLPAEFIAHVNERLDRDEVTTADSTWWCEQLPTGTARHWVRWRVSIRPGDPDVESRVRSVLATHTRLPGVSVEDHGGGAFTLTIVDAGDVSFLRVDLEALAVPFDIAAESVPAPSELLG